MAYGPLLGRLPASPSAMYVIFVMCTQAILCPCYLIFLTPGDAFIDVWPLDVEDGNVEATINQTQITEYNSTALVLLPARNRVLVCGENSRQ